MDPCPSLLYWDRSKISHVHSFIFVLVSKRNVCATDPMCAVIHPSNEADDATLMCKMTYEWQARPLGFNARPILDASLGWTGVPGTTVSTTADPATFSGTLETNTTIDSTTTSDASSYSCTIEFTFSPASGVFRQWQHYAVNPLSYTCHPTQEWCKCDFITRATSRSLRRNFYPRDVMLALVLAMALCLSLCLSVCPSKSVFCRNG